MKKTLLLFMHVLIGATAIAQTPPYVPTNGLLGWWPFSGNANDLSINGNNGTVSLAQLTFDRFGINNSAYSFNDSAAQISIPLQQDSIVGYTISAWFKTTDGGPIVTGRGANGETGLSLHMHNSATGNEGLIHFIADGPSLVIGKITDSTFDNDEWHHVVGVFNGSSPINPSQFEIYIDTVLVAQIAENTGPATTIPIFNNTSILFGAHQVWPGGSFKGIIAFNPFRNNSAVCTLYCRSFPGNFSIGYSSLRRLVNNPGNYRGKPQ